MEDIDDDRHPKIITFLTTDSSTEGWMERSQDLSSSQKCFTILQLKNKWEIRSRFKGGSFPEQNAQNGDTLGINLLTR